MKKAAIALALIVTLIAGVACGAWGYSRFNPHPDSSRLDPVFMLFSDRMDDIVNDRLVAPLMAPGSGWNPNSAEAQALARRIHACTALNDDGGFLFSPGMMHFSNIGVHCRTTGKFVAAFVVKYHGRKGWLIHWNETVALNKSPELLKRQGFVDLKVSRS